MKKELVKIVSLVCDIHDTTPHRVSVETFASLDSVQVRIYVGGYSIDKTPIIFSSCETSLQKILYALLEVLNHGKEIAA